MQVEKHVPETNLFLEGEEYTAVPYQVKPNRNKQAVVDITTMPHLERKGPHPASQEISKNSYQIHSRNQHEYSLTIKEGSL